MVLLFVGVLAFLVQNASAANTADNFRLEEGRVAASFISDSAIKVTWSNITSDVIWTKICERKSAQVLHTTSEEHTFWGLTPGISYSACWRTHEESEWKEIKLDSRVHVPPGPVTIKSNNRVFERGDDVTLQCSPSGFPSPRSECEKHFEEHNCYRVSWFKENKELEESSKYQIFTEGKLVIKNTDERDEGHYHCRVANPFGIALSSEITLKIAALMPFHPDERPQEVVVPIGDGALLTCHAPFSFPPAIIFWERLTSEDDYHPIRVHSDNRVTVGVDGSLLFVNTKLSDKGLYQCNVHNPRLDHGHAGSLTTLGLNGHPSHSYPPRLLFSSPTKSGSDVALVGDDVTLQCVFRANPSPEIRWFKDDTDLGDDTSHHVYSSANQSVKILKVKGSDEGQYRCEASNEHGSNHIVEFSLLVHDKPHFITKSSSINVTAGDSFDVECPVMGLPDPLIRWLSNGSPITSTNLMKTVNSHVTMSTNNRILTFTNVTKEMTMTLTCAANNVHGRAVMNTYINVHDPTVITKKPKDVVLKNQEIVKFECEARTDPGLPLVINWYRGQNLRPIAHEKERIVIDGSNSLVLNLTAEEDGGRSFVASYTCVASNGIMTANSTAKLRPASNVIGSLVRPLLAINGPFPSDLLWVAICVVMAAGLVFCLGMACYMRRRHKNEMRSRVGTDVSAMTQFSPNENDNGAVSGCSQEGGLSHLACVSDADLRSRVKEVFIERTKIQLSLLIGKGQFGRVYSAVLVDPRGKMREQVAVKTLKYKAEETEMVELFLKEALMMRDFKHLHVLSLIGITFDMDGSPMVVLPFMEQGDLRRFILNPAMDITVLELLKLGVQVTRGMVYLSSMRFVHRDLAARNCMVDADGVVKVADFGLSRELFKRDYYRVEDGKTPLPIRWMAPECLDHNVFTTMSDVWSLGVLLWELMTRGAVPYPDVDNWDIPSFIQNGRRLPQPAYCPCSVYEIMCHTWAEDPLHRPTFPDLVMRLEVIIRAAHRPGSPSTGTGTATLAHLYTNITAASPAPDYRQTSV